MKSFLTSLAVLISCAAAQAEFVIDDFGHAVTNVLGPAVDVQAVTAGTRTNTVSAGSRVITGNNAFRLETAGLGSSLNMVYSLAPTLLNITGGSGNPNLLLDIFRSVQPAYDLAVTVSSGASDFSFATLSVTTAGARGFDLTASGFSSIDTIDITITRSNGGGFRVLNTPTPNALISANPEPASLALLGMTGLGGWFVARRRAKKTQPVA